VWHVGEKNEKKARVIDDEMMAQTMEAKYGA